RCSTDENNTLRYNSATLARNPRIGGDDLDGDAMAQPLLAGRHHDIARFDAFDDLDMTGFALAQAHLGLDRLAVDDPVDKDVGAARDDGAFRHRDDTADLRPLHGDAREQTGPQRPVLVGQPGADLQGAAVHVHHGIDGIDDAGEGAAGEGIDRHQGILADFDVRQEPLGNVEVELEGVDLLKIDDGGPDVDEGADRDRAQPDHAGKRRQDHVLAQAHTRKLERGAGALEGGPGLVARAFGDVAGLGKAHGALVVGLGQLEPRLLVGDFGARERVVELDQLVAQPDLFALLENDLGDPAGELGRDVHRFVGLQTADRADVGRHR